MTVTLELTPEEEARLRTEAGRQGRDETALLRQVVQNWLAPETTRPFSETATLEEWTQELHRQVNDFVGVPHLTSEALRRENIYEERL